MNNYFCMFSTPNASDEEMNAAGITEEWMAEQLGATKLHCPKSINPHKRNFKVILAISVFKEKKKMSLDGPLLWNLDFSNTNPEEAAIAKVYNKRVMKYTKEEMSMTTVRSFFNSL